MIIAKQQMYSQDYPKNFETNSGKTVKIGNYSFNVHTLKDEIENSFLFNAFPDGFYNQLATLSIQEQIKNYRYIAQDITITFSKDDSGKITCDMPLSKLNSLWEKAKEIDGQNFDVYRMQNILVDKNGVVIGFSGKSEFSIAYEMLYINKSVSNVWEASDNNGAGYKSTTYYLDVSLIRDPKTYKL